MKLAYYEENNYHTEIFGTFLYYAFLNNIQITVFNDNDKSGYISYYKNIHNFDLKMTCELEQLHTNFDNIIIGTSSSINNLKCIESSVSHKLIYVCHLLEDVNHPKNIVLTPLNKLNSNTHYVLPIHNFITNTVTHPKKKNIITLIGRFKDDNRNTKDIIETITKCPELNYEIHIYSRHKKFVPNSLFNLAKIYPARLKIYLKFNTTDLEKRITESKFLVTLATKNSWYHKDRLSGVIPLAFNYNIPLILDDELNKIYNFTSSVVYNESLMDKIQYITNMSDDEYIELIKRTYTEKNRILKENNLILFNLFQNTQL